MDMGLLGSYLAAGKQGYDTQDALDRQRQAWAAQQQRLAADDARKSTLFDQEQQDWQHKQARQPIVEKQQDDAAAANLGEKQAMTKRYGLMNALSQNEIDRLPTTNAQKDQAFETNQQLTRSRIANSGQEMALRNLQIQMQQMGVNHAQLQEATDAAQRGFSGALGNFYSTGSSDDLMAMLRKLHPAIPDSAPAPTLNKDGTIAVTMADGTKSTLSQDRFSQRVLAQANPMTVANSMHAHMSAESDPKNWETLESVDQGLRQHNKVTGTIRPILDADGKPFYGRLAGRTDSASPEAAFSNSLRAGNDGATAVANVREAYPNWNTAPRQTAAPQATGMGQALPFAQAGAAQAPRPTSTAQPRNALNPGQAVTMPTNSRAVIRSGVDQATGQRVNQYDDGSIGYAQ